MRKDIVLETSRGRVVIMDSIAKVTLDDKGSVVVAASHGGASSGEFALEVPLDLVVLNDAGVGKDDAGIAALGMLQGRGVAGVTVGHDTARIGDSLDMWECGVISRVNEVAKARGFAERQKLRDAIETLVADR